MNLLRRVFKTFYYSDDFIFDLAGNIVGFGNGRRDKEFEIVPYKIISFTIVENIYISVKLFNVNDGIYAIAKSNANIRGVITYKAFLCKSLTGIICVMLVGIL